MIRWSHALPALVLLAAACGDDTSGSGGSGSGGDGDELEQGFTECGAQTCQPGTHCSNGGCLDGCLSSTNCAEGENCTEDPDSGEGSCLEQGGGTGGGATSGGHTSDCDGYAAFAQECGLAASFAEAIRQSCDTASQQQKDALVACAASESCDEFKACSGVECFADADCDSADCIDPNEAGGGQYFVCAP